MVSNKKMYIKESDELENKMKVKKATFCILSNFRAEISKFNLMLFTLDESY